MAVFLSTMEGIKGMDKQEIKIDDAVVKKTTKCHCGFSCLSKSKGCLCSVLHFIGHEMVQIKSNVSNSCNYHILYGNEHFCLCPIRSELYQRYRM